MEQQLFNLLKKPFSIIFILIVILSSFYHHHYFDLPSELTWFYIVRTDLALIVLVSIMLYHCIIFLGKEKGLALFFNVSIYIGGLEAFWVFMGKLGILGDSYEYNAGALWFFGVPLYATIGWFVIVYLFYFITKKVFPNASALKTAIIVGLMAICLDIWLDPVVASSYLVSDTPNIWDWSNTKAPKLFNIPLYNFIGFFLAPAFIVYVFETTFITKSIESYRSISKIFKKLFFSWLLFIVVMKSIQIALSYLPNYNWLTLNLVKGELTLIKTILLFVVPFLLLLSLIIAIQKAFTNKKDFRVLLFIMSFIGVIVVNLRHGIALQLQYSETYLIYITVFPMLFPLGVLLKYLYSIKKE